MIFQGEQFTYLYFSGKQSPVPLLHFRGALRGAKAMTIYKWPSLEQDTPNTTRKSNLTYFRISTKFSVS